MRPTKTPRSNPRGFFYASRGYVLRIVWATKRRNDAIIKGIRSRLYHFVGGVVRHLGARADMIGGIEDHVHMLIQMPPRLAVADLMRHVKARSGKWAGEHLPSWPGWQEGYSVFSVSPDALDRIRHYIETQEIHHASSPKTH